ncbi:M10 family metallopeptidase C-terminal domain-containing protein [Shimia sp. CNT1-13L.2]|uniref:M10 family metallopeptidase n=1 Tax=Shimia sp. CNT1-13L.2 TaxID=2959663 RepID=UPI0020CC554E|nr:M10 family metallopeptidase [Shimia sp. CNT1-13L.2]MCP9484113.1 M10 family metallopeptidase C-terminal domain-containing protein [Shimia sp. CNT1-13L.2]
MPVDTSSPVLSAIHTDQTLASNHVKVYFAADGEKLDFVLNQGNWTSYEQAQVMSALETYAAFTNLTFAITNDLSEADFKLTKSSSEHGSLGFMNGPDPALGDAQGIAWFNTYHYWGDAASGLLDQGSYTYTIFLHEFGHGLGLAHPHDTGGGSTIMPQVGDGDGLDQGVYTVMTYNDGWPDAPEGSPDSRAWGWNSTPSPIDIAVLQEKYGTNPTTGAGNTQYILDAANQSGTGYRAIWDVSGTDEIRHNGNQNAVIDLRAATLLAEVGGGGFVSHASGIHGGFTIAHGVTIENATGGHGRDKITGNEVANNLNGREGVDTLNGHEGADTLVGGQGGDKLFGGLGKDRLEGSKGNDVLNGQRGFDLLFGGNGQDKLFGGRGFDTLKGGNGADLLNGNQGNDVLTGGAGADVFVFAADGGQDTITDFTQSDTLDLSALSIVNFAAVQAAASTYDQGTRIVLNTLQIDLQGFAIEDLTEDLVLL